MVVCTSENLQTHGRGPDYYTTWSTLSLPVVFALQLLLLGLTKTRSVGTNSVAVTYVKSILVAFIGNSLIVALLSQCLYTFNFRAKTCDAEPKDCTSIEITALKQGLSQNFWWHIIPTVAAILLAILSGYIQSAPQPIGWRLLVNVLTISTFILAWSLAPTQSKRLRGVAKIREVYAKPRPWMAGLFIAGLIGSYVLLNKQTFRSNEP